MITQSLLPKSSVVWDKQSQRVNPSSYGFLFATFRCLKKAHSHEKGVSVGGSLGCFLRTFIPKWCHMKKLFTMGNSSHFQQHVPGYFACRTLTLLQYVGLAYRVWWSKVTINDLRTNVSLPQKSTKGSPSN